MIQDDNLFKHLAPPAPAAGGGFFIPPEGRRKPPPLPGPPTPDKPGEAEARDLRNERLRQEIEAAAIKAAQGPELAIEERKAAGFYSRMLRDHALFGNGAELLGPALQTLQDLTPQNFANAYGRTPEQRAAKTFIEDFIRAKLRLESGAVIGKEELQAEYPVHFPMPGDQPEDLERKKGVREQALLAMRTQAGPAAEGLTIMGGETVGGKTVVPAITGPPVGVPPDLGGEPLNLGDLGSALTPGQLKAYDLWRVQNPKPTAAQLTEFFARIGAPIDPGRAAEIEAATASGAVQAPGSAVERKPLTPEETTGDLSIPDWMRDLGTGAAKAAGTAVEGALALPGIVANPITAGINLATGSNFNPDLGENARTMLGLPKYEGAFGNVAEAAVGALGAAGAFGKAADVVTNPSALAAFTTLAKEPIRQTVAAATGALSGEGARAAGAGPAGQIAATVLGGGAGYGGTKLAAPSRAADPRIAAAARAEDVPIVRPMIEGNRRAINRAGTLEANQATAPIIQEGFARPAAGIERGVGRLGAGGTPADRVGTGETIRQAAKNIVEGDKRTSSAAYKAAEAIDGDPLIDPAAMRAKVDAQIAKLGNNPNANKAVIRELQIYRKDIAGPKPLSALRDLRTTIRDNINANDMTRSSAQKKADARMLDVLDGTKDDIKGALSPEAWAAWQKADAGYAASMGYIKDALIPFLGKDFDQLPAEAIADRLTAAAKNNSRALAELHRRLPPQKQQDLAATFADVLGKAGPDDPFSTARFISQARKLSNQSRETLFGQRGAQSFNNLLVLARRLEFAKSQVNVSKTARPVRQAIQQKLGQILGALTTGGGAIAGGAAGAGAGLAAGAAVMAGEAGARALSARRLMDPKLSLTLADAASARDPASYRDIAVRLGALIARDPGLQEELGPLQQELEKAGGGRNKADLQTEDTR